MLILFVGLIALACMGRRSSGRRSSWHRGRRRGDETWEPGRRQQTASAEERFEEWHRRTHAWVDAGQPEPNDSEPE